MFNILISPYYYRYIISPLQLDANLSQSLPANSSRHASDNLGFSTSYPPPSTNNKARPPHKSPPIDNNRTQAEVDLEELLLEEAMRQSLLSLHTGIYYRLIAFSQIRIRKLFGRVVLKNTCC